MSVKLKPKHASQSFVEVNHLVLPSHTNALGTIFGGVIMSWIDVAAAICAQRHSHSAVVTASVDALFFLAPVRLGDTVTLKARVIYTGKTSMVIAVKVSTENFLEGRESKECVTAHLSFVALDSRHKPKHIPPLQLKSRQEKKDFEEAKLQRDGLLTRLRQMQSH